MRRMKTITYTLSAALRQMLDDSDLRQEELAELADISKGSVTNYAKGRTIPRWTAVQRWAVACGYDPDDPTLRALWDEARSAVTARYHPIDMSGVPPGRLGGGRTPRPLAHAA